VAGCRLLLTNLYGALLAQQGVVVGLNPGSTANRVLIDGGQLRATNISGTATFDLRRGTNVLNAGLMDVDQLLLTNITGVLEFNGGTLIARSISANNGRVFRVGNGVDPATLQLPGGVHAFANSLEVLNQGTLVARGTVLGPVSLFNGSILSPGPFLGRLFFGDAPLLQGATVMEISKTGLTLTNDMIQVFWPLTYGGSLIVSNVGPSALTVSNRFQLFSATAYAGSFSSVTLPPLPPGQEWKNKLLVDGSIEVAAVPLQFSSIKLSGTNMIISGSNGIPGGNFRILTTTDLMRPVNLWDVLWVGQFDANGAFLLTNAMAPGESARFFRIRIP
jgi:hypothetical protein